MKRWMGSRAGIVWLVEINFDTFIIFLYPKSSNTFRIRGLFFHFKGVFMSDITSIEVKKCTKVFNDLLKIGIDNFDTDFLARAHALLNMIIDEYSYAMGAEVVIELKLIRLRLNNFLETKKIGHKPKPKRSALEAEISAIENVLILFTKQVIDKKLPKQLELNYG